MLCDERGVDVITWVPSTVRVDQLVTADSDSSAPYGNGGGGGGEYQESQVSMLRQFLFKSSRYTNDQIFSTRPTTTTSSIGIGKCLLIKEMPNFAYHQPASFHAVLRDYVKFAKAPLVFSLTSGGQSGGGGSSSMAKLLPSDLRAELGMLECVFNPIAATYTSKHVERIVKLERLETLVCERSGGHLTLKEVIAQLVAIANGDLRHALNQLELIAVRSSAPTSTASVAALTTTVKKQPAAAAKRTAQTKTTTTSTSTLAHKRQQQAQYMQQGAKDVSYDLFRGIGRVLYRKHLDLDAEDAAGDIDATEREQRMEAERRLPAHLLAAGRERRALSVAPEDTLTKIPLSADAILLYLHQNFIELFAIKTAGVGAATFERQFEALESILDGLCAADRISTASFHYEQAASNGVEPGRLKELCALVAMRSVLFNFYLDESNKPPSTTATKNVWMPLHKPFVYKMNETRQKRSRVARDIVLSSSDAQFSSSCGGYSLGMDKEFFTTILPYVMTRGRYASGGHNKRFVATEFNKRSEYVALFGQLKAANTKTSSSAASAAAAAALHDDAGGDEDDNASVFNAVLPIGETMKATTTNANNNNNNNNYAYEEKFDIIDEAF